jgi:hypothetical protein
LLEYNDSPKIIFCSENMFLISLEGCLEDLKNLETCLNCFDAFMQKISNKQEIRKRKEKEKEKIRKGPRGHFWPSPKSQPRPNFSPYRNGTWPPLSSTDRLAPPTRVLFFLWPVTQSSPTPPHRPISIPCKP